MVLQFTLKPGAHEFLFDPDYMAIARPKDKTASGKGATAFLAQSQELKDGRFFQTATTAEGNLPGYIGMKPEDKGDFSLSLGKSDPSRLTFQLFIAKVDRVDPQTGAIVDWDTGLPI